MGGQPRNGGFSLVEVIVVIALMAVLFAMALPPFLSWRQNMNYRQVARGITAALGDARSKAITTNRQHGVKFDGANRRYTVQRGNRSYGFANWSTISGSASPHFPAGVSLDLGGVSELQINYFPNGTASEETIRVTDGSQSRYQIRVERTGRIRSEKVH